MSMMDIVMDEMMGVMTPEEKEAMILEMMPAMMNDVDMVQATRDGIAALGRAVSLTGLVTLLVKASKDRELRELVEKLGEFLRSEGWDIVEIMLEMMPEFGKLMMNHIVEKKGFMSAFMPGMMIRMMPHCMVMMSPLLGDRKNGFVSAVNAAAKRGTSKIREN